jgi:sterol desaturase/sphingolipid hydroxylase (fatty acid hydroxylase superfamily)
MSVLAFLPVIITVSTFAGRVSLDAKVESDIVNGIVTVSGLIFAFQPSFFRKPKDTALRLMFTAIFLVESLLLGLTAYSYVVDALSIGGLSEYTLLIALGSLILNISMIVFFVIVDLAVHSHQNAEK